MTKIVEIGASQRCESYYIGSCKVLDLKICSECKQNITMYKTPRKGV